jgi:uncharacterized membrane protein YkoI
VWASYSRSHAADDDGSYTYELELVDEQGVVWDLEIDARTGKLLEKKQDD